MSGIVSALPSVLYLQMLLALCYFAYWELCCLIVFVSSIFFDVVVYFQVQWAGFDKLECEGVVRRVLLLCYRSGFQVWDVEEGNDVRELVSRHDGPVSFLQVQPKLVQSKRLDDKFSDVRPLLVVAGDGVLYNGNSVEEVSYSTSNENVNNTHEVEDRSFVPTFVRFYSLKSHSYVHVLKFRTAIYSIRCSPRVVAISQAAQVCILSLSLGE